MHRRRLLKTMKAVALQPEYARLPIQMESLVKWLCDEMDACDDSVDLIVLPEGCNGMCHFDSVEQFHEIVDRYTSVLLDKASETAKRCGAVVAINLYIRREGIYYNTTCVYDKTGVIVGEYLKQQVPHSEWRDLQVGNEYTKHFHKPYTLDIDGVRYAFLTCYDCYFNEYIQHIAAHRPDVIIISALQRGEQCEILEMEVRNAAFVCNAYAVRSSVSMGDDNYPYGASSMIAGPDGKVLARLGQKVGVAVAEFDPHVKHMRPDTYNNPLISNELFIEQGRTPWAYRTCGPSVCLGDSEMPYPRLCAHRGFNTIAPENTLPAFGAAIALGANEIELDVWSSKDGELVVSHDETVDRMSDGTGAVMDLTWDEISRLDAGRKTDEHYTGLSFCRLKDVLAKFSRQAVINMHIKTPRGSEVYDRAVFKKIVDMIYEYDMQEHVYIGGEEDVLITACEMAPELPRAALDGKRDFTLVKLAKKYHCKKLQLFRGYYNQAMIDEAREAGIRCNLFWSDSPDELPSLLDSGIDTILTNDYLRMSVAFKEYLKKTGK